MRCLVKIATSHLPTSDGMQAHWVFRACTYVNWHGDIEFYSFDLELKWIKQRDKQMSWAPPNETNDNNIIQLNHICRTFGFCIVNCEFIANLLLRKYQIVLWLRNKRVYFHARDVDFFHERVGQSLRASIVGRLSNLATAHMWRHGVITSILGHICLGHICLFQKVISSGFVFVITSNFLMEISPGW